MPEHQTVLNQPFRRSLESHATVGHRRSEPLRCQTNPMMTPIPPTPPSRSIFDSLMAAVEVDRIAFIAAHPEASEASEALRSFFGSVSLLQQLAGPGGLGRTEASGAMTRPPRGLNFSAEDATDSHVPWTYRPAMFGRYRVESLLGRGAIGEVYRAHDTQLDRPVALKLSHFPRNTVLELRERLLQEARAAANLSHPNICRVYDVGEIGGTRFIAMELIEGRPLADYIRTNRLPPPKTAATLVRKLALALQMAHDKGLVHRDLKPTNVIVKADHEPILMDFGLAQRPVPNGWCMADERGNADRLASLYVSRAGAGGWIDPRPRDGHLQFGGRAVRVADRTASLHRLGDDDPRQGVERSAARAAQHPA